MPWDQFSFPLDVRSQTGHRNRWAEKMVDLRLRDSGHYLPLPVTTAQPEQGRQIQVGAWTVTPHRAVYNYGGRYGNDAVLLLTHADGYRIGLVYTQTSGTRFPYSQLKRTLPYLHALLTPARAGSNDPAKAAKRAVRQAMLVKAAEEGLDRLRASITAPDAPTGWGQAIEQDDDLDIRDFVAWVSAGVPDRLSAFEMTVMGLHPMAKTADGEFVLLAWRRRHDITDPRELAQWADLGVTVGDYQFVARAGLRTSDAVRDWRNSPACDGFGSIYIVSIREMLPQWRAFQKAGWTPSGLRLVAHQMQADTAPFVEVVRAWECLTGGAMADAFLRAGYTYAEVAAAQTEEKPSVETLLGMAALRGVVDGEPTDDDSSSAQWRVNLRRYGYSKH